MTSRAIFTVTAGSEATCAAISRTVGVELVLADDPAHDAVRERLVGREHAAGEHEVADEAGPGHLEQRPHAPRVRNDAVRELGEAKARAFGRDPHVAQQRPLERRTHDPALAGDDHRGIEVPELLDAPVPPPHELVVRDRVCVRADRADITSGRERLAFAAPHDRSHLRAAPELAENLEETRVHLVVERVVLLRVVVGDDRDRAVELEPHSVVHRWHIPAESLRIGTVPARPRRRHVPIRSEAPGGVAEWHRQRSAKPCTRVRFPPPPPTDPHEVPGRGTNRVRRSAP